MGVISLVTLLIFPMLVGFKETDIMHVSLESAVLAFQSV